MRVLHVINSLKGGGAEKLLLEMLPRMKKYINKLCVFSLLDKWSEKHTYLEDNGIKVVPLGCKWKYSMRILKGLLEEFKKGDYNIIHSHLFPSQYWVALLPKAGTRFITTEHSTYNSRRNYKFLRLLENIIYNRYDKIICISNATSKALEQWVPRVRHKILTIYNGIDLKPYMYLQPVNKKIYGFDDNTPLVISVSRLTKQKDHSTLIRAISRLPNVHLLIVGDGPLKNKLENLSLDLGIKDRVHFLGYRDDVPQLLSIADVFVQSSHWEGFGLAVVEAMATGLPVIVSDVPGLNEVVEYGKSGLLFPVGDHITLGEKIRLVINNKEKYRKLAINGKKRATLFAIENMIEKYIKVYYDLLGSNI